jgi:hypothetical protein
MNRSIVVYRRHTKGLDVRALGAVAKRLALSADVVQTDDALVAHDGVRALAYAQPCSRFAGVLFYADETTAWAEPVRRALTTTRARRWAESFLRDSKLLPGDADGGELAVELDVRETKAVVFDGRERRPEAVTTDVSSRITLDGVDVIGPRGKVRLVFKADEHPALIHVGLWESLARFEERELVGEHEIASAIRERLADRKDCNARTARLADLRLVYWAGEFAGGPDLLTPWYFAEIELTDPESAGKEPIQGPRQVVRVPAVR